MIPRHITALLILLCEAPEGELNPTIIDKLKTLTSTAITIEELEKGLEPIIAECIEFSFASDFTMVALRELETAVKNLNNPTWKNTIH